MAKSSFKDMIFKLLQKDEDSQMGYVVKFAKSKGGKISTAWYKSEVDAKKALDMLKKDGLNGIITRGPMDEGKSYNVNNNVGSSKYVINFHNGIKKHNDGSNFYDIKTFKNIPDLNNFEKELKSKGYIKEDTPANATGTAVVGTGDDSSTVVVKKKKELQSKLMKRFKIKETIDRVIPDLFEEEDEITKRTNQLKELALKSEGAAVPKDKDTDQPKKYVAGLSDKEKKSHDRHLEKQGKKSDSDKSAYKQSPADKVAKTKPSKFTNKFKQMYGEETLDEVTAVKNKAEKSGMPYPILKKVYDRGMAAWKGGHRPGTTPQQWAFARVNSFTTKSSGTWGKADSDLAKQVRGS
jgi:hypothetical protein